MPAFYMTIFSPLGYRTHDKFWQIYQTLIIGIHVVGRGIPYIGRRVTADLENPAD